MFKKTLEDSLEFLVDSMVEGCKFLMRAKMSLTKPTWVVETEKFGSLVTKIKDDVTLVNNLKVKSIRPVYDLHKQSLTTSIVDDKSKVQDDFLRCDTDMSGFVLRTEPEGLFFSVGKLHLPVSEVYTHAVKCMEKDHENISHPVKILLGLYCVMYHTAEHSEEKEALQKNVELMVSSLDSRDETKSSMPNPMNMVQNMLGNIDINQISEMMGNITGDEKASKEFSQIFSKMSDVVKDGGNPMEAMGELIKQASLNQAQAPAPAPATVPEHVPESSPAQAPTTVPEHAPESTPVTVSEHAPDSAPEQQN